MIIDDEESAKKYLANTKSLQSKISRSVSNGLSKIYVGQAPRLNYKVGEPVLIYRKYNQGQGKRFRSCITSFCIVTNVFQAKSNNRFLMSFDELKAHIGNKSVFDENELLRQYHDYRNVTIVELLYYGYFGAGNNVNMDWLSNNGYWAGEDQYPTEVHLNVDQFKSVLTEGNINVSNVIVD